MLFAAKLRFDNSAASELLMQKDIRCFSRVRAIGTEQSRLRAQNTAILVIKSVAPRNQVEFFRYSQRYK
jgi:hypothetical protein